jgi:transposase
VTDGNGIPLAVTLTAGERHESTSFESAMNAVDIPQRRPGRPRRRPAALAADKAYSYKRIRDWLRRRKITPVIPQRANQDGCRGGCRKFDAAAYRRRNVVERCVGWLKECRRVATRYEKLATSYLGMLKLALIQRYLRLLI